MASWEAVMVLLCYDHAICGGAEGAEINIDLWAEDQCSIKFRAEERGARKKERVRD